MLDWPFFGYSFLPIFFYNDFGDDSNNAHLSEWLANVVTISDGHLKNDKQSVKVWKGKWRL